MSEVNAQQTEPRGSSDEISLLDLTLVLAENLRLLILVPLAAGLVALGWSYFIPPSYTATTRILPPFQQQSVAAVLGAQLGAVAGLAGAAAGIRNPVDQFVALIKSEPVLDAIIERFKLKELWKVQYKIDARVLLARTTVVSANARDGIISIDVDDPDPKRAADIANAYVEELRNLLKTFALTEPAQRRLYLETQLRQVKDKLTTSEIALRESGVSEANLRMMPQSTLAVIERLRAQITAQEIKLASMHTSMTDSNPDIRIALQELAALRIALSKAEQSNTAKAGGGDADYIVKFRDFKYYEAFYDLMAKQYEGARLDEAREGPVIQVLDPAEPPVRKSKPHKSKLAVLTTLAVFFVMILFVFMRHTFQSIANDDRSTEKLGRLRQLLFLRRA